MEVLEPEELAWLRQFITKTATSQELFTMKAKARTRIKEEEALQLELSIIAGGDGYGSGD